MISFIEWLIQRINEEIKEMLEKLIGRFAAAISAR
jgi:hypothetical protein